MMTITLRGISSKLLFWQTCWIVLLCSHLVSLAYRVWPDESIASDACGGGEYRLSELVHVIVLLCYLFCRLWDLSLRYCFLFYMFVECYVAKIDRIRILLDLFIICTSQYHKEATFDYAIRYSLTMTLRV